MKLVFTRQGWQDYLYWQSNDRTLVKRINRLIEDVLGSPFAGIGKPGPLRHTGPDVWSRRITEEHRLMYLVQDDAVTIVQARFHY
jgi:toxin YoeB